MTLEQKLTNYIAGLQADVDELECRIAEQDGTQDELSAMDVLKHIYADTIKDLETILGSTKPIAEFEQKIQRYAAGSIMCLEDYSLETRKTYLFKVYQVEVTE